MGEGLVSFLFANPFVLGPAHAWCGGVCTLRWLRTRGQYSSCRACAGSPIDVDCGTCFAYRRAPRLRPALLGPWWYLPERRRYRGARRAGSGFSEACVQSGELWAV